MNNEFSLFCNSVNTPLMVFTLSAYNKIVSLVGSITPESGGLLMGYESDYIVRDFIFDSNAQRTNSSYTLNVDYLNVAITEYWNKFGMSVLGFLHSHPLPYNRLSSPDVSYFKKMFPFMPRPYYLTPIVFTIPENRLFEIHGYIMPNQKKTPLSAQVLVIPDEFHSTIKVKWGFSAMFKRRKRKGYENDQKSTMIKLTGVGND